MKLESEQKTIEFEKLFRASFELRVQLKARALYEIVDMEYSK